ncbi:DNA-binding GntR family transcriptional regulator [Antricoccus suffuscus]|uniref:DNA-binding GntR family transcriptional regulator n=1 Tax=Antricoccus suffuscus TaxID=1629062 RepID=A0A2T1A6E6_9ACTN|nr:GntR family transcriptional regulator [Antricoccus suffuscus]PRZ44170.1 DNA-binding GntR family transcriptional regulator [Antricoccus suffuscus]
MPDAYERLRAEIVEGEFAPGTALVEVSLAERYGTSRTPIREALRRLEQDGLVERGSRGMCVRTRSPEEILEIYEVRITLEATASGAAAQRRTELDLMRIKAAQSAMARVSPSDPHAMAAANRNVHETIWAASHNGTIVDLLTRLNNHLTRYPATTLSSAGRWDEALAEHEAIIAAIEARDHVRAAELAGAHMETARNLRLEIYSKEIVG